MSIYGSAKFEKDKLRIKIIKIVNNKKQEKEITIELDEAPLILPVPTAYFSGMRRKQWTR